MVDRDLSLYRYVPFERFYQMLFNKELVLVSPNKWPDEYEGLFLKYLTTPEGEKAFIDRIVDSLGDDASLCSDAEKKGQELINHLNNHTFCLCFSKGKDEEVLWSTHSDDKKCVMFETTARNLMSILPSNKFTIEEVKYDLDKYNDIKEHIDKYYGKMTIGENIIGIYDTDGLFLHKRKIFSYEQEVRLVYRTFKGQDGLFRVPNLDLSKLIKSVMVHPLASDEYVTLIKFLCDMFHIPFEGRSKIYTFKIGS